MTMKKLMLASLAAVTLATFCGGSSALAGAVTYPDFTAWSGAVPSATAVTIPDPAPNSFTFIGTGSASVTLDSVTFSTSSALSDGNFFNVGHLFSGQPAVLSSQQQTSGVANILITLPGSETAFSLDYGTFSGSNVTFRLSNGDTITQSSANTSLYAAPDFFGITDSASFTSVLVTSTDPVLSLNNIAYGAALPEPASMALLGAGVLGLGLIRRKRVR